MELGDETLPASWLPNAAPCFGGGGDPWDLWENEKFMDECQGVDVAWGKALRTVRRVQKLLRGRTTNRSFCNKSSRNLRSVMARRWKHADAIATKVRLLKDLGKSAGE